MAEAGYSEFETTQEPEDAVMAQMSELYGWETQDDEGGMSVSVGGPADGDVDIDEAALAELQEYEIAVATADYDCEQEHYADVQHDVAWAFEEEFVEEHRAELERFRDAMAEGPDGPLRCAAGEPGTQPDPARGRRSRRRRHGRRHLRRHPDHLPG